MASYIVETAGGDVFADGERLLMAIVRKAKADRSFKGIRLSCNCQVCRRIEVTISPLQFRRKADLATAQQKESPS